MKQNSLQWKKTIEQIPSPYIPLPLPRGNILVNLVPQKMVVVYMYNKAGPGYHDQDTQESVPAYF